MKLKKILISQPEPADLEKSPYKRLASEFKLDLTFYKFFEVVGISATEFRKSRIHITDYTAVIFNSKNSVDHFFRMAKELREVIPESMKYFCPTEAIVPLEPTDEELANAAYAALRENGNRAVFACARIASIRALASTPSLNPG